MKIEEIQTEMDLICKLYTDELCRALYQPNPLEQFLPKYPPLTRMQRLRRTVNWRWLSLRTSIAKIITKILGVDWPDEDCDC